MTDADYTESRKLQKEWPPDFEQVKATVSDLDSPLETQILLMPLESNPHKNALHRGLYNSAVLHPLQYQADHDDSGNQSHLGLSMLTIDDEVFGVSTDIDDDPLRRPSIELRSFRNIGRALKLIRELIRARLVDLCPS